MNEQKKNKAECSRERLRADIDCATRLYEVAWLSDKSIKRTDTICGYLMEKGYGDVKQAVREFAEKIKENLEEIFYLSVRKNWGSAYEYINELVKEVCGE